MTETEPLSPARQHKLLAVAWIPHWALLAGQVAHGASWVLLAVLGAEGLLGFSFPGLAWVHVVALGYLTLISLAVLVHVLHGMADIVWKGGAIARWSLLPFTLGAWGLAAAFWLGRMDGVAAASGLIGLGLIGYGVPAAISFATSTPEADTSPAVIRAFVLVLLMLAATAVLGYGMARALAVGGHPWWLSAGPAVHAHLGAVGWLSLLVIGVSRHTSKPITGLRSPAVWRHIASSGLVLFGLLALTAGLSGGWQPLVLAGAGLSVAGAWLYAFDMLSLIRRSTVPHKPPQAFVGASSAYFAVAAVLGAGVALGKTDWQAAYAFVGLMGWLGQMVVGHLYHIGVRVLTSVARGEDDETRPWEVLSLPLSWATFGLFQSAMVLGAAGLLAAIGPLVVAAGVLGLVGWGVMGANMLTAWRRANA
ncbi:MAG: hypothetical protein ACLGIN_11180 [Candidatus Sericytochromatia bacterium]